MNGTPTTQRAAAGVALAGAVALLAFVVVVFVRNGLYLLAGIAALALATAGGWQFLTERMPRQAIGLAVAIAGVVVFAVSAGRVVRGTDALVLRLILFVALLALTLRAARAAVRRDDVEIPATPRAGGAPRRAVLLCNPKSGGGKVEKFGLVALAQELGVETAVLGPDDDLEQLARDAVARGADCLGMAGGDGSQAMVASIAVEHDLPFVCVSAGTRNHFALDLGLNRDDPRESVYAFRDAIERRVDYATVNGRFFVNNVSLGVYAEVVQDDDYRDAKIETAASLLPELLGHQSEPFDLRFTAHDGTEIDGAIVVMVSNNPYALTFTPDAAQRHRLDTGRLGVFAVSTGTGAEAARLLNATALGFRRRSRFWHEFTADRFEVRSRTGNAAAGVDGEALQLDTPMDFRIHPQGLVLLVPEGNVAAATARAERAVRLRDLVAIAAGREPASR